jgi:hypothetical protein
VSLIAGGDGVETSVRCRSCANELPVPAGRFVGIVNVVSYVADLEPARRTALLQALQTVGAVPDRPTVADFGGLADWFTELADDGAFFWRSCLLQAIHLVPEQRGHSPNAIAIAREVARQAGASRSFVPRR